MKFEDIKKGQYLYYTERGVGAANTRFADCLFYVDWDRGEPRVYCVRQAVHGKYENQQDYLGGRLYPEMGGFEHYSVAHFPGGDAAAWMSQNYPLDGRAHE
jgi:hypothetical protein